MSEGIENGKEREEKILVWCHSAKLFFFWVSSNTGISPLLLSNDTHSATLGFSRSLSSANLQL